MITAVLQETIELMAVDIMEIEYIVSDLKLTYELNDIIKAKKIDLRL